MTTDEGRPQDERPELRVIPEGGGESPADMATRAAPGRVIFTDTEGGTAAVARDPGDLVASLTEATADWMDAALEGREAFRHAALESPPPTLKPEIVERTALAKHVAASWTRDKLIRHLAADHGGYDTTARATKRDLVAHHYVCHLQESKP